MDLITNDLEARTFIHAEWHRLLSSPTHGPFAMSGCLEALIALSTALALEWGLDRPQDREASHAKAARKLEAAGMSSEDYVAKGGVMRGTDLVRICRLLVKHPEMLPSCFPHMPSEVLRNWTAVETAAKHDTDRIARAIIEQLAESAPYAFEAVKR